MQDIFLLYVSRNDWQVVKNNCSMLLYFILEAMAKWNLTFITNDGLEQSVPVLFFVAPSFFSSG